MRPTPAKVDRALSLTALVLVALAVALWLFFGPAG